MKGITFILIKLLFVFSGFAVGQETISREEFWKPIREAYGKAREYSRRHIQKIDSTWNGVKTQEEWTYEYQPPDRIRYLHVRTFDGKTKRTEQINIGEQKYCKEGSEAWYRSKSYCIGGSASGGPSDITKEEYRRKNARLQDKDVVIYSNHTIFVNKYSKTVDTDGPTYWESKYWFDKNGLILRSELRRGLVKEPKPYYEMIETYQYDPKIKIEAPIK
jgi:hypothetical protein